MKKLSRNEMRNVIGGLLAPPVGGGGDGGGITCKTSCSKVNSKTFVSETGTCSKSSATAGGFTMEGCDCSVGGSGCY